MTGVPGMEKSRLCSSSMRRRLFSSSGASRRRIPTLIRICGSAAYALIHVVAFFVRHHLERELVVVPEEHRPLAVLRNLRRLPQDLDDRVTVFLPQRHEHARHQREVERHVAFVAVAEIRSHVGRPLVRLRQQHPVRIRRVERLADLLQDERASPRGSRRSCPRARSGTARRRDADRRRLDRARTASP